jgi:glycerol-3-phosphate responsive antiterminator
LPPIWGIKHQINLVPRAFILNRLAYKSDPNEIKKLQWQVGELNDKRVHKKKA